MTKDDCNAPGTMRFGANGPSQHDADTMPVTEFSPTRDNVVLMYLAEVYRDALGRVSVAGSPARREPWRAPAVEDGIEARVRAPSLAGSTDAYDRRCHPAAPDHARRPPRRGRAAARPHH